MNLTKEKVWSFLLSLTLILLFIFSIAYLGEERIRTLVESAGIWAPILMIVIKILTIVIAPLSGAPLYIMAGTLFGVSEGLLYIIIGDAIGYSTAFFISRYLGRERVEKFMSKNESGIVNTIVKRLSTIKGFLIACCIFCFASELVAYAAGLSRLPFRYFLPIFMAGDALIAFVIIWTSNKVGISFGLVAVVVGSLVVFSSISYLISRRYERGKNIL
jgi:uncharacterized membrane protein YdjX (TVP38/TMEM64 family)